MRGAHQSGISFDLLVVLTVVVMVRGEERMGLNINDDALYKEIRPLLYVHNSRRSFPTYWYCD